MNKVGDITEERITFKPFKYPWAYDAWLQHEQSHWLHTEVPMSEDVKDYKKLKKDEQEFLTKILRFFVQGDLDIGSGYHDHYIPVFKQPEVKMMLSGFASREALHVAAYAHLIETLGSCSTRKWWRSMTMCRGWMMHQWLQRLPPSAHSVKACSYSPALLCC